MNDISNLFLLNRFIVLMIIPAITSIITIIKIIVLKKRNGSVIYKKMKIDIVGAIGFVIGILYISISVITSNSLHNILVSSLIFIVVFTSYIEKFLESILLGIYEEGIVFPGYSTGWSGIESYISIDSSIRLIHCDKGAFDIQVNKKEYERVKLALKGKGIIQIDI